MGITFLVYGREGGNERLISRVFSAEPGTTDVLSTAEEVFAAGLDYDTAAPIRGVRSGGDEDEEMEVYVSVSSMQQ
ncbi:MAG: hypothetical protein VW547_06335 [Alphaproteobacteria bacterium]